MGKVTVAGFIMLFATLFQAGLLRAEGVEPFKPGVVRITAKEGEITKEGTGFIVSLKKDRAYIVTAAHVVRGDKQPMVELFTNQNVPVQATVVDSEGGDAATDLALLMVRGQENLLSGLIALSLAPTIRLSGGEEDVRIIGFPRGAGPWAVLRGSITSIHGRKVVFDANIDEGNSGGPMIQNGQVVGLVAGRTRYGLGVTAGSVQDYLNGHRIFAQEPTPPSVARVQPTPNIPAKPGRPEATLDREITGKDGAPMVLIPAGSFKMGTTKDEVDQAIRDCVKELGKDQQTCEDWHKPELPQHKVQIDAFYFDKYEVTNRLFQQFVQQTGHRTTAERDGSALAFVEGKGWEDVKGASWQKPEAGATVFDSNRAEHPVVSVSWEDSQTYCRWADKRLPKEAEWEYATRAGTTTRYWWGNGSPGSRQVENIADETAKNLVKSIMTGYDDGSLRTAPVGSYEANPWGLHDMSGNVAEWTADWFDATYYKNSPERKPKGPSSGEYRVLRGGSWFLEPVYVRSATRDWVTPTLRLGNIGFRCAQDSPK